MQFRIPHSEFLILLHAHGDLRGQLVEPGQGGVHGLLILGDVVADLLAVHQKDHAEIVEEGLAAAELAPDLLDPDEGSLHLRVGHGLYPEAVPVIDRESAHPQLVKALRALIIRCQRRGVHPLHGAAESLFRHGDSLPVCFSPS